MLERTVGTSNGVKRPGSILSLKVRGLSETIGRIPTYRTEHHHHHFVLKKENQIYIPPRDYNY